ncbi:MAG: NAD(P)-dependent oxidoreductase [Myxococcota bacterium]
MRVLFADKVVDRARVRLAAAGCEVRAEPGLAGDLLTQTIREWKPEVLVVRSTKVTREMIEAGSLSLVVRAGAGFNTIDVAAASGRGVFVANCPGKNADAVAELALGLMLAVDRSIADCVVDLRAGRWNKGAYSKGHGLKGRTLGILGMGMIGQETARRARAFGMEVVAWSRSLDDEKAAQLRVRRMAHPEDVASRADVLSVHLAASTQTKGLIGRSIFDAMKHGAIFVNTSRSEVVDEDALRVALDTKGIRAGLDVFSDEPGGKDGPFVHPLASHPSVVGTHHIGASTSQAQEAVADEACRIIEVFRSTGRAPNCVNLSTRSASTHALVVRHLDRVGVLAEVLGILRADKRNVGEMENTVFVGGGAATARIGLNGAPSADALARIEAIEEVLHTSCVELQETP